MRRLRPLIRALLPAALVVAGLLGAASGASAKTTWLCRPGQHPDPCAAGLSTTVYPPALTGATRTTHPKPVKDTSVDCFYAYPTVSDQKTRFANLQIDPEERSIALQQAARFSQVCHVWAPVYRQGTLPALLNGGVGRAVHNQLGVALHSLSAAFADFLAHDSRGRPFVVIAHSQGAILMQRILAAQVDDHPAVRRRLLSAILLGGNVSVKDGENAGGSFRHIPACRTATENGCVIAYSTFDSPPPANTLFGSSPAPNRSVLCVDPARLAGDHGLADPIFTSAPFAPNTLISIAFAALHLTLPRPATTWVSAPGSYTSRCTTGAGPHVLLVAPRDGAPLPTPSPNPTWGLHLLDANIELGNLLTVVTREIAAYESPVGAIRAPVTRSRAANPTDS